MKTKNKTKTNKENAFVSWTKEHYVATTLIVIILLSMVYGIVTPDTLDTCSLEKKQIANLENGLSNYCEYAKLSADSALATIDLLESTGNYEASNTRPIYEELRDLNCYTEIQDWKNK